MKRKGKIPANTNSYNELLTTFNSKQKAQTKAKP